MSAANKNVAMVLNGNDFINSMSSVSVPTGQGDICPICYEEWTGDSEDIVKTPCEHIFHRECLSNWVLGDGRRNKCPACRQVMFYHLADDNALRAAVVNVLMFSLRADSEIAGILIEPCTAGEEPSFIRAMDWWVEQARPMWNREVCDYFALNMQVVAVDMCLRVLFLHTHNVDGSNTDRLNKILQSCFRRSIPGSPNMGENFSEVEGYLCNLVFSQFKVRLWQFEPEVPDWRSLHITRISWKLIFPSDENQAVEVVRRGETSIAREDSQPIKVIIGNGKVLVFWTSVPFKFAFDPFFGIRFVEVDQEHLIYTFHGPEDQGCRVEIRAHTD